MSKCEKVWAVYGWRSAGAPDDKDRYRQHRCGLPKDHEGQCLCRYARCASKQQS